MTLIEDNLLCPQGTAALIIRLNSMLEFIHSVKRDSEAFQVVEMKEKEILIRQHPVASKETTDDGKRS